METTSTCPYCGVGRGVLIKTESGRITDVRGDPNHPANFGRLCTKGATLHLSATKQNRLLYPTRIRGFACPWSWRQRKSRL